MAGESGGQTGSEVPGLGFAPGTEVAGFTIEGIIASGSFGTVYRARRGGRPYAIKLVPVHPRADRETAALRQIRHPNVVSFHGYCLWPEKEPLWLVLSLELVEGLTLDAWAARENPSALELVMRVLLPLALTLADVHASGVVHRDIKESNIIVREADGQPVLVDFGAAGLKEGALRLTMRLPPGTAEYRSPEALRFAKQWEGEHYPFSPGDDLWALGVVIYALLTRTLPFGDRNDPGLNRAILEETPPGPHERNPRVPLALSELCMGLLEKDAEDRYPDAKALAEHLVELCTEADGSWRSPMFPGAGPEKRSAPAAPAVPGRPFPWRWWAAAGLALTAALLSLRPPGDTPRTASAPAPTTLQSGSGQEVDAGATTAEVVPGAGPETSPTPAPVAPATNSKEPSMKKSKTIRTLVAAGCVAGSAGCVSGPRPRPPPPPEECPPGAEAAHRSYRLYPGDDVGASLIPFGEKPRDVLVRDGQKIRAESRGRSRDLPDRTALDGHVYVGEGRVYARFTTAHLPNGETIPVCLELVTIGDIPRGAEAEPGSTPTEALTISSLSLQVVKRFR
ncbi:MAG TPA: serine/threonine-protein kinase [Archangium sp.]|uniref:serine/threonine protein kinase n=1 Tax=Archangium sp. TaxID=1872627 RepID=UPI002E34D12D|nr:serine/threonine-protein kinase [Archangium sp.]HEX5753733.1 serine/threonine-protein kinase [Archangium sp.]